MQSKLNFTDLPVYRHRDLILESLEKNQVIIVESPTGSGKTTQIPLILKEAGYDRSGIIGVTQPRRIATLSVCDFIRRQLDITDNYCAYTMRFFDTSDESTRIKIMTDGILLEELKSDRFLSRYSCIMVDEAHERSLNIDFILGLLKQVLEVRPDLKVIVSSATINTECFSSFFNGAKIITIPTKVYPVDVVYSPVEQEEAVPGRERRKGKKTWQQAGEQDLRIEKIYSLVEKKIKDGEAGDVLVFLPGEAEIIMCEDRFRHSELAPCLQIYPLYGRLSKEEQERVFIPTAEGKTKVVIATNIAETSITINGIRMVIDSGLAKVSYYDQRTFTSSLIQQPISKASAEQRKGRAGRTQSGICYRLYTEESFSKREEYTREEITRCDLAEVALRMSELGIYDYDNFPFITAPKKSALASAAYLLKLIGAIDDEHHLTAIGEKMAVFPLLPRLSRGIVESIMKYPDVISDVITAASFLSTKGPFLFPKDKAVLARTRQERFQDAAGGDFAGYLKLYRAYSEILEKADSPKAAEKASEKFCRHYFLDSQTMNEIVHIKGQLEEIVSHMGIPVASGGPARDFLICLGTGLLQFVCIRNDYSSYRSLTADEIYIHPSCSWFSQKPDYIIAGEVVLTSRLFARSVSPLKAEWLDSIYPELKKLLRFSSGYGYENIEKSTKTVQSYNEKQKEKAGKKKEAGNGRTASGTFTLFGYQLSAVKQSGKSKKKERDVYAVKLSALADITKKAFEAGSVPKIKVMLTSSIGINPIQLPLKTLIQEAALITGKKPDAQIVEDEYYSLADDHLALAGRLDDLFTPTAVGSGKFGFLTIVRAKNRKGWKIYTSTSLPASVDNAYLSLNELMEEMKDNKKRYSKLIKTCSAILTRLDELEGLNS